MLMSSLLTAYLHAGATITYHRCCPFVGRDSWRRRELYRFLCVSTPCVRGLFQLPLLFRCLLTAPTARHSGYPVLQRFGGRGTEEVQRLPRCRPSCGLDKDDSVRGAELSAGEWMLFLIALVRVAHLLTNETRAESDGLAR